MLFNTAEFLKFFVVFIALYFTVRKDFRWMILLSASYWFYMCWEPYYALLIAGSTVLDYSVGRKLATAENLRLRRILLAASIALNLGLLFVFKYYNFTVTLLFGDEYPNAFIKLLLPVGISFYTFQTMSYTIDVFRKRIPAETHLGRFALFVIFFPQLVAGPIERHSSLAPQLNHLPDFDLEKFKNGLRLILYGLFIKMVIADNLAPLVDSVYANPELWSRFSIVQAIFFYSFQIYCDFHGYTLIAIGAALVLGIELMDNFKTPYFSAGIAEFWRNWHISLSTWFRDYVYIPLGGGGGPSIKKYVNVMVVFIASGIWHGANLTFVVWGLVHAILYIIEAAARIPVKAIKSHKFSRFLYIIFTFILISMTWVVFRAESLNHCFSIFHSMVNSGSSELHIPAATLLFLTLFLIMEYVTRHHRFDGFLRQQHTTTRWITYSLLVFSIVQFAGINKNPFIYFQF